MGYSLGDVDYSEVEETKKEEKKKKVQPAKKK